MESIIEGGIFNYHHQNKQLNPFSPLGRFQEMVARPEADIDLAEAALMIAGQEYKGLNESYYLDRLDAMAADMSLLLAGELDPYRIIGVLNSYLYGTLGYKGNETNYADPCNSYLSDVLERRTGIPITLSLVYLEIGKRLGLPLEGVGLPGHFIVRYLKSAPKTLGRINSGHEHLEESRDDEQILVDPFNGGAILSEDDCARLIGDAYGRRMPRDSIFIRPIGPRQFLTRMLTNLKESYVGMEDVVRALEIEEFILLLNPQDINELRHRGMLYSRNGQRWRAIYDLQLYLAKQPDVRDAENLRQHIRTLHKEIAIRN
ncbi:MAG: transglutaminase-like domain-containing protein [Chloroflexota bacterium]|nr:tetratricopeptide repeat protein [Chloroflexota bacterium]